jgi:hypothetical protein
MYEQTFESLQMNSAKLADGAKVWFIASGMNTEDNVFSHPLLDPPRRKYTDAAAVNQDIGHHARMIGRIPEVSRHLWAFLRIVG